MKNDEKAALPELEYALLVFSIEYFAIRLQKILEISHKLLL